MSNYKPQWKPGEIVVGFKNHDQDSISYGFAHDFGKVHSYILLELNDKSHPGETFFTYQVPVGKEEDAITWFESQKDYVAEAWRIDQTYINRINHLESIVESCNRLMDQCDQFSEETFLEKLTQISEFSKNYKD